MLVNFNRMLRDAQVGRYAVGSFNVYNYETMKGVVEAAREAGDKPVIVAFGTKYLSNMSLDDAHALASSLSDGAGVPVCLHLDHCKDTDTIYRAIRAGFTSVMYDGSALPFGQNADNTRRVCDVAHACGLSVEAELGSLAAGDASHEGTAADRQVYTDPGKAGEFVERTGADALAVSVGTVHGLYKGAPNIRLEILEAIRAACPVPLVLHGGSGVPAATIRDCIARGICKINVNTEISVSAVEQSARLLIQDKKPHLSVLALAQQVFVKEVALKYIGFFEGTGAI